MTIRAIIYFVDLGHPDWSKVTQSSFDLPFFDDEVALICVYVMTQYFEHIFVYQTFLLDLLRAIDLDSLFNSILCFLHYIFF